MCAPAASFIHTKDKVEWSEVTDSHTEIREEKGIPENTAEKIDSVQTEFLPDNLDYSLPLDQWKFKIDQDLLPDWFVPEYEEKRARVALAAWAKEKLKVYVDRNTGDQNTGDRNTGDQNTGDQNTGDQNTGDQNTGDRNTGDRNTGYRNTGDQNTGDRNTGYRNTGYRNTGYRNTGDQNTGDQNTGDRNTGYRNTGDRNTGDWNSANNSTGVFCTEEKTILIFDSPTNLTISEWRSSRWAELLQSLVLITWIDKNEMVQEEIDKYPEAQYLGGYLKKFEFKEACANMWVRFTQEEKEYIQSIPNFDDKKFESITGIKI